MSLRILLIGHAGFWNRGCEAIVRGTVAIIKEAIPDSNITLVSAAPEQDSVLIANESIPLNVVEPFQLKGKKKPSIGWVWQTFSRKVLNGNVSLQDYLLRKHYKESDIVISVGGDNFSDDYGSPEQFFDSLDYAKKLGSKVAIWGASIGPFKQDSEKWANCMKSYDLITVREDKSFAYLNELGVSENVRRVADPAFVMPSKNNSGESPLIEGKEYVGIGVSALIGGYITPEVYYTLMAEFCDYLYDQHKLNILLVPHVIKPGSPNNDDFVASEAIVAKLAPTTEFSLLQNQLNACEMKYYISKCKFFIGARTHSTIASISTCVPTISIGYSVKAYGINIDIFGHDDYVISNNDLSLENLKKMFLLVKSNYLSDKAQLDKSAEGAKEQAKLAGKYLKEVLAI